MEPIKLEYKTYEQLKEELGSEYDTAMYEINMSALHEIERLNSIIKRTSKELEMLLDSENIELIIMQLNNIVFRLKGE